MNGTLSGGGGGGQIHEWLHCQVGGQVHEWYTIRRWGGGGGKFMNGYIVR